MLQRISIEGIKFPRLYMAENDEDVRIARANGIPYVKWRHGMNELVRQMLRPTLERMFPGIDWNKVLGKRRRFSSEVMVSEFEMRDDYITQEVADYDAEEMLASQLAHEDDELEFADEDGEYCREVPGAGMRRDNVGGYDLGYDHFNYEALSIEDYVGDLSSSVDIDALQKLSLLPKFVGDIADCIKLNLSQNMRWTEGYTKKLGVPLGKFNNKGVLPNLIIIDVSASIPDGIAATMLTLADTLRENCNAELIITSARSGYYPIGSELPSPQTLRRYYGRSNESAEFMAILEKYIAGREFAHVICFGDYDCPGSIFAHYDWKTNKTGSIDMIGTRVHELHYYHTGACNRSYMRSNEWTGYGKWVEECCPNVVKHFDTSWATVMRKRYRM